MIKEWRASPRIVMSWALEIDGGDEGSAMLLGLGTKLFDAFEGDCFVDHR